MVSEFGNREDQCIYELEARVPITNSEASTFQPITLRQNINENETRNLGDISSTASSESSLECTPHSQNSYDRQTTIYMMENFLYESSEKSKEQHLLTEKESKPRKDEAKGDFCQDQIGAVDEDDYSYEAIDSSNRTGWSSMQPIGGLLEGEKTEPVTSPGKHIEKCQDTTDPETQEASWPAQANNLGNKSSKSCEKKSPTASMSESIQTKIITPKEHQARDAHVCETKLDHKGYFIDSQLKTHWMNNRLHSNDAICNSVIEMVENEAYGDIDPDRSEVV